MTDPAPADSALWQRMRSGDLDACGLLFERHSAVVYRFCVRFLGSSHEAEDALSETFLEVWRCRRTFEVRDESALPILLAIARRSCQKRRRGQQRRRRIQLAARGPSLQEGDIADQVVDRDDEERRRGWLRDQVSDLPVAFRDVFELCVYGELPYAEVSSVLGIPLGTVKSRMARARAVLEARSRTDPAAGRPGPVRVGEPG